MNDILKAAIINITNDYCKENGIEQAFPEESDIIFSSYYKDRFEVSFGDGESSVGTIYRGHFDKVVFETDRGIEFSANDLLKIATKMIEVAE